MAKPDVYYLKRFPVDGDHESMTEFSIVKAPPTDEVIYTDKDGKTRWPREEAEKILAVLNGGK